MGDTASSVGTAWRRALSSALVGALALSTLAAAPTGAEDELASQTVAVSANAFRPYEVRLRPGGTITWVVDEGGHTIRADDGRFSFGSTGTPIPAGQAPSFTFGGTEEYVRYHCTIHGGPGGQGMAGIIRVGRPTVPRPAVPVIRVPQDVASVEDAIASAVAGDRIEIAPGTWEVDAPVEVDRDGITVTGMGGSPGEVRLVARSVAQASVPDAVLRVTGANVAISNLEVARADDGIHLVAAHAAALTDVWVAGEDFTRNGIVVIDGDGAGLRRIRVRDVTRAGIRVEPCLACGVHVEAADVHGGLVGILVTAARGVVVRSSRVEQNAVGVVARALDEQSSVIELRGNQIHDNVRRDGLPAATNVDRRLATGAGVWLAGTIDAVVADNVITGNTHGVVVSDGALRGRVSDNEFAANGLDLAWDGVGVGLCFAAHGAATSSAPTAIEALYPCDRPTVGVPYPPVNLGLLLAAYA